MSLFIMLTDLEVLRTELFRVCSNATRGTWLCMF